MNEFFRGLLVIMIAVAVVVVIGQVIAVPVTDNLAEIEQARVAQVQAREAGHTERMQTFALTLTGLVVVARSPDGLFLLLVPGLYAAAGLSAWLWWRARG